MDKAATARQSWSPSVVFSKYSKEREIAYPRWEKGVGNARNSLVDDHNRDEFMLRWVRDAKVGRKNRVGIFKLYGKWLCGFRDETWAKKRLDHFQEVFRKVLETT